MFENTNKPSDNKFVTFVLFFFQISYSIGYSIGSLRQKKKKEALLKKQEQERKELEYYNSNEFESEINRLFKNSNTIIDSNIWMDWGYDSFFKSIFFILNKYDHTIKLHGYQFDEICNLKKCTDNGDKSKAARRAIKTIEYFQAQKRLEIISILKEAKKGIYADPMIIESLISGYQENSRSFLITNDKELRIRARQILKDHGFSNYEIIGGDKLNNLSKSFCLINDI